MRVTALDAQGNVATTFAGDDAEIVSNPSAARCRES
jgi:hypothetical protein